MKDFREWLSISESRDRFGVPMSSSLRMKAALRMVMESMGSRLVSEAVDDFGRPDDEETRVLHEENKKKLKESIQWNRWYAMAERLAKVEVIKGLADEYKDYLSQSQKHGDKPYRHAMRVLKREALPILENLGYVKEDAVKKDRKDEEAYKVFETQLFRATGETGNDLPAGMKADQLVRTEQSTDPDTGDRVWKFTATPAAREKTSPFWTILTNDDGDMGSTELYSNLERKANSSRNRKVIKAKADEDDARIGYQVATPEDLVHEFMTEIHKQLFSRKAENSAGVLTNLKPWKWPSEFGKDISDADVDRVYDHFLRSASGTMKKAIAKRAEDMAPASLVKPQFNYNLERRISDDLKAYELYKTKGGVDGSQVRDEDKSIQARIAARMDRTRREKYLKSAPEMVTDPMKTYRDYLADRTITAPEDSLDGHRIRAMRQLESVAQTREGAEVLKGWENASKITETLKTFITTFRGRMKRPVTTATDLMPKGDDGGDRTSTDISPFARDDSPADTRGDWSGASNRSTGGLSSLVANSFRDALQEIADNGQMGAMYAFSLCSKWDLEYRVLLAPNSPRDQYQVPTAGGWLRVLDAHAVLGHASKLNADGTERGGDDCMSKLRNWGEKGIPEVKDAFKRELGIDVGAGTTADQKIRRYIDKALEELCAKLRAKLGPMFH